MATKAGYFEQGRLNCKSAIANGGGLTPGSWQHTAYMAGVAKGNEQDAAGHIDPPLKLSGRPRGWDKIEGHKRITAFPMPVVQHIAHLARERASAATPERRERLDESLARITKRWNTKLGNV